MNLFDEIIFVQFWAGIVVGFIAITWEEEKLNAVIIKNGLVTAVVLSAGAFLLPWAAIKFLL